MIDRAAFCIGRWSQNQKIIFPMICCEIYTGTVAELQGCAETWVNSQNTKPGLLVTNAGGGGGHALDGLWQEVNCGSQRSFNVNTSEPNTSSQSADVFFFYFFPLTVKLSPSRVREQRVHDLVRVAAPVAVLHHVSQHSPQDVVQSGGFLVQEDARLGQEAVQVSVGAHFLLEVHRLHILVRAKNNKGK